MKRSILGSAVALLLAAGHADATVTLNPDGLGQGLLFPFYTTQNGQTTLLNVQNQSGRARALKVRVMEAHAGKEVLTFNAYVPAWGRWSAALALPEAGADTPAVLLGNGSGCTVPQFDGPEPLRTFGYEGDGGPQSPARTRRGYVEVVEMGGFTDTLAEAVFGGDAADCGKLEARFAAGGTWDTTPTADLGAPAGKLRGDAVIMDTADGTTFGYPAVAFDGLSTVARQYKLQGTGRDLSSPRLADIPVGAENDIRVSLLDAKGEKVTLRYPAAQGFLAIGALLASNKVQGMYNIHPAVAARSEWVISYPTRAAHTQAELPLFGEASCLPVALQARTDAGKPQYMDEDEQLGEIETCGSLSTLQVYSKLPDDTFHVPPGVTSFDSNTKPIFVRDDGDATNDDPALWVTLDNAIGSAELDFAYAPLTDGRRSPPDLDGKCWAGLPAWVWQVQASDNANAQPGRISTFPEARVASSTFEIVDCFSF